MSVGDDFAYTHLPCLKPIWSKGGYGVAVYTKKKPLSVTIGIGADQFDDEGRVLTLEFADFFLINAYFPNAQHELKRIDYKLAFNNALFEYAKKLAG